MNEHCIESIAEHPLHSRPGISWWICQEPERPFDPAVTGVDFRCRECCVAALAAAVNVPGVKYGAFVTRNSSPTLETETRQLMHWVRMADDRYDHELPLERVT